MATVKEITYSLSSVVTNPHNTYENKKPMLSMTISLNPEDDLVAIKDWLFTSVKTSLQELEQDLKHSFAREQAQPAHYQGIPAAPPYK